MRLWRRSKTASACHSRPAELLEYEVAKHTLGKFEIPPAIGSDCCRSPSQSSVTSWDTDNGGKD